MRIRTGIVLCTVDSRQKCLQNFSRKNWREKTIWET